METKLNVARRITDFSSVTGVLFCIEDNCPRTVVEYGPNHKPTKHCRGLSRTIMQEAEVTGLLEFAVCDHHGGPIYQPNFPSS